MGPVEITTIAALIVTILTSLVVPWWLRRRQAKQALDETGLRSWQSVTHVLQEERDDLKKQITTTEREFRERLRALEEDYDRQLAQAKRRIADLETEVAGLYARLGRGAAGLTPEP